MNIQRAHAFAKAIGLETWVARKPLGQAGHRYFPKLKAQPDGDPNAAGLQTKANQSFPLARPVIDVDIDDRSSQRDSGGADRSQRAQAVNNDVSNLRQQVVEPGLSFTLMVMQSEHVLLIDDISQMRLTPSAYVKWINALFSALGVKELSQQRISQGRFSWPLKQEAATPQYAKIDSGVAMRPQKVFSAWLNKSLSREESLPDQILLMGDQSASQFDLTLEKGVVSEVDAAALFSLSQQNTASRFRVLPTFNTRSLWQEPSLKRVFWQQIQRIKH